MSSIVFDTTALIHFARADRMRELQAASTEDEAILLSFVARELQQGAAQAILANTPRGEQEGPEVYVSLDTLLLRQATCYTEAGKPAKGAAVFDQVLKGGKLSHRDIGFFRARRSTALALSGEPDEAAEVGLQAWQTACETNSGRTIRILSETAQALKPWNGRPGPRALRKAVLTNSQ
jgi:hypothetical protein